MLTSRIYQNNDPSLYCLSLVDVPSRYFSTLEVFINTFGTNSTITRVELGKTFFEALSNEDQQLLLKNLGQLQSLKEVHMYSVSLSMIGLSDFIDNCYELTVLMLHNVELYGSSEDAIELEYSFFTNRSIQKLSLVHLHVDRLETRLKRIMMALSRQKGCLRELIIEGQPDVRLSSAVLAVLCNSCSNVKVTIKGFTTDSSNQERFGNFLQKKLPLTSRKSFSRPVA